MYRTREGGGMPSWQDLEVAPALTALLEFQSAFGEIIDHLNVVLMDLDALGSDPRAIKYPVVRYALLVRTFFYEYGRTKDVLGSFLRKLERLDRIEKGEAQEYHRVFYERFRPAFEARNRFIHGPASIGTETYRRFAAFNAVEATGLFVLCDASGADVMSREAARAARAACDEAISDLTGVAAPVVEMAHGLVETIAPTFLEDATSEE